MVGLQTQWTVLLDLEVGFAVPGEEKQSFSAGQRKLVIRSLTTWLYYLLKDQYPTQDAKLRTTIFIGFKSR